jgi:hypothetical protein
LAVIYDTALDAVKKGGVPQIPKRLRDGPPMPLIRPVTAVLDDIIRDAVAALKAPYK